MSAERSVRDTLQMILKTIYKKGSRSVNDSAQPYPAPQNGKPDRTRELITMLTEVMMIGGIGFAAPVSVMVADENGVPREVRTTPAQLISDLVESIKDLTASNDERLEFDEGILDAAEQEAEEEAPRRKRRRT